MVVAFGSDLTIGNGLDDPLRQAWPYLYVAQAFPLGTKFVNGATEAATVADAERDQAGLIDQVSADVVAILLGTDDVRAQTPIDAFESALSRIVSDAKSHGVARLLLAEIPRVGFDAAAIAPYNAAINRVAQEFPFVELVKLATTTVSTFPDHPTDPDPAGQATIARAFVEATS